MCQAVNVESRQTSARPNAGNRSERIFVRDHKGKAAFRRVASKGVYAGGGSIAEGGQACKRRWERPSLTVAAQGIAQCLDLPVQGVELGQRHARALNQGFVQAIALDEQLAAG